MPAGNITLTPSTTANSYTVNFDAGEGIELASKQVTYNSTYGELPTPTKVGYTFGGWYTGTNGTGTKIESTSTVEITENITLHAKLIANSYTIAFNINGGTSGTMSSITTHVDENVTLPANTFKKTSYIFVGWNTKADGTGTNYIDGEVVKNLTTENGATVTLYAQWGRSRLVTGAEFNQAITGASYSITDTKIKSITFGTVEDYQGFINNNPIKVDIDQKGIINAYKVGDETDGYDVYVLSSSTITPNVNCSNMFANMTSLTSVDISAISTSSVTDMSSMFESCTSLEDIDIGELDTAKVTDFSRMFYNTRATDIEVSAFNTSNATTFESMFEGATGITVLDVTNFDLTKVTNTSGMFKNCTNLTTIYGNKDWNTGTMAVAGSNSTNMFEGSTKLIGAIPYTASKKDINYANPTTGYFIATNTLRVAGVAEKRRNKSILRKLEYSKRTNKEHYIPRFTNRLKPIR